MDPMIEPFLPLVRALNATSTRDTTTLAVGLSMADQAPYLTGLRWVHPDPRIPQVIYDAVDCEAFFVVRLGGPHNITAHDVKLLGALGHTSQYVRQPPHISKEPLHIVCLDILVPGRRDQWVSTADWVAKATSREATPA